ncbi:MULTISPECIES: EscI/YscI/HrpB family type III secretion system inner rod protein [unclassified Brenneria]|uniref:EscI/YscI/HrpB family type III secretion system inner rod protein n=1 Tax=unclassified Brenneria TaxID=2634434 RepID=UPI0029C51AEC|nr:MULTISPECIES: EscI/YscI/HrpB family type III secretion system inner rod protein [unclassified Brenneria]MDX5626669.1 EscI/YscI/HrpB family type III secretion system inner rod protein [Brenneria sp. L3-3Z]MDX5693981.1 EscI/YscI/HrpB family type III secretion system inner rod protein [Brenneria sp. L4-2C]MEE3661378.1 EscI/YscI/HrpB family type III secretion system inner rod protein [Brenneria sp. g21c3]
MKINQMNASTPISIEAEAGSAFSQQDIAWFSASLTQPPSAPPAGGNSAWLSALAEKSQGLNAEFKNAEREVTRAVRLSNPKDVLDSTRTLSSFYLESLFSAKLVAKSVQSVEKLTNLQ